MRSLYLLFFMLLTLSLRAERLEDRLRMLMPGAGPEVTQNRRLVESRLEEVLRRFRREDQLSSLPLADKLTRISTRLQAEFLQEFRPDAELIDAVRDGIYSDATATILFALSLEHFNVAHELYVDHWETYLLVDPSGYRQAVRHPRATEHDESTETTFRRQYLSLIRSTVSPELPSLSERQSDSVFYRYYYHPDQRLTMRQLSGFQQLRLAQRAYSQGNYADSRAHLDQARLLDDRPALDVFARATELQIMAFSALRTDLQADRLFKEWQQNPDDSYYPTLLLQTFDRQQRAILAADRLEDLSPLTRSFTRQAPKGHEEWADRLETIREIRLMQHYIDQGKVVPALELAEQLLSGDTQNPHYQAYVAELSLHEIQRHHADPKEQVRRAKTAVRKHPFVDTNARYADIILRESALTVRDHFAGDREADGLRELNYFRAQLERLPQANDRGLWTLTAFVAASNFYFAAEDYPAARRYVEEALSHHPTSEFLIHQLDLLGRY
ncbi:MAG: hypothetical protein WA952_20495 [Lewinella sp.]